MLRIDRTMECFDAVLVANHIVRTGKPSLAVNLTGDDGLDGLTTAAIAA
jgi:hypothetical protein